MKRLDPVRLVLPLLSVLSACGGTTDTVTPNPSGCQLTANTTPTSTVNAAGCAVESRDTSSCQAARTAQGLSGVWLKFSCRVGLTKSATQVLATADDQPDYLSMYFPTTNACYETYAGGLHNPNQIAVQSLQLSFPLSPDLSSRPMGGTAVVGLALNGVAIYGNFAAPGDDIFFEAMTFDRCGAHPDGTGRYHYHGEPYAISYDDANFIGVMRDGYPIYGRRDRDGSLPTLDSSGGHSALTADSPTVATYHYHVNQQTSTSAMTAGQKQYFLTTGTFRGTPAACTTCN